MNKIGLITYYGDNFGACLQAYALQRVLTKIEGNCDIIACPEGVPFRNVENNARKSLINRAIKILFKGEFLKRYKTRKYVLNANKKIHNRCELFRKKNLNIAFNENKTWQDFYNNVPNYDIFVCGSDQIWNPTFYGQCHPIYYLDFVPQEKIKVAYAASIGVKNIADEYKGDLVKYLSTFNAVSVREENAVDLIQPYYKNTVNWVLDPTLLLNLENYSDIGCCESKIEEPYIFCYLFGNKKDTAQIKKIIAERLGVKIISVPFVSREILSKDVKMDDIGPVEFINLIRNAKLVLTDSFHATAFSINFQVPFISLLRQEMTDKNEMSSRLYSILKKLHLEHRLVSDKTQIPDDLLNVDFSESQELLNQYREMSFNYLKVALGKKDK